MQEDLRIIFKDNSAVIGVRKLASNYFWNFDAIVHADEENQIPYELHFSCDQDKFKLIYLDDPVPECAYVIISGEGRNIAATLVRKNIKGYWKESELLKKWSESSNDTDQILTVLRLGLAAPFHYNENFAKAISEGLNSNDCAVREASIAAVGFRDWREFDNVLFHIAEHDEDKRCRDRAALILQLTKD